MRIDFTDRHVVVTGGGGELGAAVVRLVSSAGATCHVPLRSAGVDLTDEAAVAAFYARLPDLWASIHCAGGFAMSPVEETPLAAFEKMHAMNAVSAFLCSREALKKMSGGGRIVNVTAAAGIEPARGSGKVAYAASKAAVAAMTVALAEEVAPRGVWVNAVAPSLMDTEANRKSIPDADFSKWPKLDEVAATIAFLASPQNAVTRGAIVPVYGRS